MTILSSDHARIILGLSSNRLYIGGSNSESFRCNLELKDFVAGAVFAEVGGWHCLLCALEMKFHMRRGSNMRFILRGRRSICWGWRLTLLAPRILNDVSYVTRINHEMHFAWQAQYLVRLEVDIACSAHSKWRFICDADQSWDAFCVAGAVFGEVGVSLFVAGAAFGDILGDSRSAKRCIFPYKMRLQDRTSKVSEAAGARWRFYLRIMLGLSSDYPRIVFILAEAIQRVSAAILNLKISWQAQYLLRLEVDIACSAHWKWSFIWDADQTWDSFCVAGAVFAEVGGWHCLLRALEMTFHMRRASIMRFILRGRRSIWWSWSVTFRGRRSIWWHFGR